MGTEVLRPQDFWADRFRPLPPPPIRRRSSRSHRKPSLPRLERPEQRRKSPSPSTSPLPSPNEYRRKSPSPSTSPLPSPPPTFPSPREQRKKSPSPSTSPLPSPPPPFLSPRDQRRKSPSPSTSPLPSPPPPFLSPRDQRRKSPSPSTSPLPSPPRPLPPSSPSPSPSPSTSSQPPREFIPHQFPRRSFSVDELQTHYNRFGAPTPQIGRARIMMRRRQSLDTLDVTRMKRDFNTMARGGLINKKYMDEDDVYAGSAFFVSPSPSSLPLPSFFNNNSSTNKTTTTTAMKDDQFHDSATRDLRRLLRLE